MGTLAQSVVLVAASLIGGLLSDRTHRRKIVVVTGSIVYGAALVVIALAHDFNGFILGMAISGLGFGLYVAVDLALVADVLPDKATAAKYAVLYTVAAVCAFAGAAAILQVKRVR